MWRQLPTFLANFSGNLWLLCRALLLCSVKYKPGDWGSHTCYFQVISPLVNGCGCAQLLGRTVLASGMFGDSTRSLQHALDVLDVPLIYCQVHVKFQGLTHGCCQGMFSSNCTWNEITQLPFLSINFPVHLHSTVNVLLAVCSPKLWLCLAALLAALPLGAW